jgi:hypothetical protein
MMNESEIRQVADAINSRFRRDTPELRGEAVKTLRPFMLSIALEAISEHVRGNDFLCVRELAATAARLCRRPNAYNREIAIRESRERWAKIKAEAQAIADERAKLLADIEVLEPTLLMQLADEVAAECSVFARKLQRHGYAAIKKSPGFMCAILQRSKMYLVPPEPRLRLATA